MKKNLLASCAVLLVVAGSALAAQSQNNIAGTVTASQIASTGSVAMWEKKLNCHGEADCARALVRAGGKYVLVTGNGTYQLSDQAKAGQFAGEKVTVAGNFNTTKKTVQVADVQLYNSSSTSAGIQ